MHLQTRIKYSSSNRRWFKTTFSTVLNGSHLECWERGHFKPFSLEIIYFGPVSSSILFLCLSSNSIPVTIKFFLLFFFCLCLSLSSIPITVKLGFHPWTKSQVQPFYSVRFFTFVVRKTFIYSHASYWAILLTVITESLKY